MEKEVGVKWKSKKQKISIIIAVIFSIVITGVLIFTIVNMKNKDNVEVKQEKSALLIYDKSGNDVYALDERNIKTKLVPDAISATYSDELKAYAVVDKNDDMYLISDSGDEYKISPNVISSEVKTNSKGELLFLTKDNELYKYIDKNEIGKLASDVSKFSISGSSILVIDNENNLFVMESEKGKIKIASDVGEFKINSKGNSLLYESDGSLYWENIEKGKKEKLVESNNKAPFDFVGDKALVYMKDYNENVQAGQLFYKKVGKDEKIIDSDVIKINVISNGVYYVKSDEKLYFTEYKKNNNMKVLDDVKEVFQSKDNIFVADKDNTLVKVNAKGEIEKLNEKITKVEVISESIASINENKELFINSEKVEKDVEDFFVNGNQLVYINESNEVYLLKEDMTFEKVINDAKEYKQIIFKNEVLFKGDLDINDIVGYWKVYNFQGNEIYYKFTHDIIVSEFSFFYSEMTDKYDVSISGENSIDMTSNHNGSMRVTIIDKDKLQISPVVGDVRYLKRISEDEYNKYKNLVDNMLPVVKEQARGTFFDFYGIEKKDGKDEYIYKTYFDANRNNLMLTLFFDEYGNFLRERTIQKTTTKTAEELSKDFNYKTYTNGRYGFSIEYPDILVSNPPPANSDGLSFQNSNGTVFLSASGTNNAAYWSLEEAYKNRLESINVTPTYENLFKNSYVISWEEDGVLHYEYREVGSGSIQGFTIKYPKLEEDIYGSVVERIYKSFKAGDISKGH